MTTPEARRRAEAAQLLRLRQLRHEQALAAQALARREQEEARAAVEAGRAAVAERQAARARLLESLQHGADLPRVLAYAEVRREVEADLLERAEYALLDEEESLDAADHRLELAGAALRKAHGRQEAAQDLLQRETRALRQAAERRAESEDPAARAPHTTASGARP